MPFFIRKKEHKRKRIVKLATMKNEKLVPAIVQDNSTGRVLMLGYVNDKALSVTRKTGKMTFFSRSKKRLWTKGEESGNFLYVTDMLLDCDKDTYLIKASPAGPICHKGTDTCWGEKNKPICISESDISAASSAGFIGILEQIIESRRGADPGSSYTAKLLAGGPRKIAKKLGEESAELIIESMDKQDDLFLNESADLMYHYLVLLHSRGFSLKDVEKILSERHK